MSRIMTKDELLKACFKTRPILNPWIMLYMIKVINGEYSILENNYLVEFVNHYKKIGVDHMYIYDNNDTFFYNRFINIKFII